MLSAAANSVLDNPVMAGHRFRCPAKGAIDLQTIWLRFMSMTQNGAWDGRPARDVMFYVLTCAS